MKIARFGKVVLSYLINKVKQVNLVTARSLVDKIYKITLIRLFITLFSRCCGHVFICDLVGQNQSHVAVFPYRVKYTSL